MAVVTKSSDMAETPAMRTEDLLSVRSRISWGPIFAGSTLALALYFLLALLGGAIGLSIEDTVRGENLATGAAVYTTLITVLCLFIGGVVTSQFSVGESKLEAVLYGLIMWAVVTAMLLWLMASGVKAGFNAMVGVATVGGQAAAQVNWEEEAMKQGVSQEQINDWRTQVNEAPNEAKAAVRDQQNQEAATEAAREVSWWAFGAALLSMLAAAIGAYVGAGPTFRLVPAGRPSYGVTHT